MTSRILASLLVISPISTVAIAQDEMRADRILSASDLRMHCGASEVDETGRLSVGYCLGAITGIADAAMTLNVARAGRQTICLNDDDDTAEKMRLAFLLFVEQRPEALDLPAATVVIATLQTSFPCEAVE